MHKTQPLYPFVRTTSGRRMQDPILKPSSAAFVRAVSSSARSSLYIIACIDIFVVIKNLAAMRYKKK